MSARILYDGLNLSLRTGTGIATYTRNLTRAAQDAGYEVSVAYASSRTPPKDSILREVMLFEGAARRRSRKIDHVATWAKTQLGLHQRLKLYPATPSGAVEIGPLRERLPAFNELFVGEEIFLNGRRNFLAQHRFAALGMERPPDVAHFTFPTPLKVPGAANIYTIHDLVPLRLPYATLDDKRYFYDLHKEIGRSADHIVTVSETSREDIIRWLGVPADRVTNTYQTVHIPEHLVARTDDEIATEIGGLYGLEHKGYFLFFGAIEPKKNVARLLTAFLSSGLDMPLVIVSSSGWQNEAELEIINNSAYQRDGTGTAARGATLKPLSYVSYESLISLIKGARAVTFPSLYEGFGLPVLEAMLLGTPVLTSNVSSLPEVVGDAAVLVEPTDIHAIRKGLVALACDDDLCTELGKRGVTQAEKFSPKGYRARVADLYAKLGFPSDAAHAGAASSPSGGMP
jgi:glycosyltransferase involved in cell wall biosynthesis